MKKEKFLKRVSVFLALIFVNQILFPTAALAVTGGPGQPELQNFVPFNSSNMVDPFTGDFNYNIPILNVPGPNGGYPINLAYSDDISVDQEAGWVGLGWSLNPGAINRQLRGLPDDFDGDQKVTRIRKMKPNRTYTIGIGTSFSEIFGFDLSKISKDLQVNGNVNLTINNYNGFHMGLGLGFASEEADAAKGSLQSSPKPSDNDKQQDTKKSFAAIAADVSKIPVENIEEVMTKEEPKLQGKKSFSNGIKKTLKKLPSAILFSGSSDNLSSVDFPRKSNSFSFEGKIGAAIIGVTGDIEFRLFYSQQDYSINSISYPAYGYMHTEAGTKNENAMLDYHTEKNSVLNPSSAFLPIPILNNDIFSVTGQGIGGAYRSQLGTIPMLSTPKVKSNSDSYGFGADFSGSPNDIKIGINPKASFTDGYSGKWTSGDAALSFFRESLGLSGQEAATYEQSAFIKLGDLTDNKWHSEKILSPNKPVRLDMSTEFHGVALKPTVRKNVYPKGQGSFLISKADRIKEERSARSNLFKQFTAEEVEDFGGYGSSAAPRKFYNISSGAELGSVSVSSQSSLIQKIEVGNQGTEYVYGIPAYTHTTVNNVFSVESPSNTADFDPVTANGTVNFNNGDNTQNNSKGRAAVFNSDEVGKYAHAYLLTEILSDDYVDITNDGPSADDFGSYTEFKYYQAYDDFKSQSPAISSSSQRKASLLTGAKSDKEDDMATYSESKKDIYYLYKVETKTHYAEFTLSQRDDDFGMIHGQSTPKKLYKLDEVTLYKKNPSGTDKEIKSVEFEYYSNTSADNLMQGAPVASNGKLTLKAIRYTFEGFRTNTYLNPYEFEYNNTVNYTTGCTDKWGNLQPSANNDFGSNYLYPYVAQSRDLNADGSINSSDTDLRDEWAASWRLKKITLPTGGEIEIDHESDDYAYVQDKGAQAMYEIVGIGSPGAWTLNSNNIYFKLKKPISSSAGTNVANELKEGQKYAQFRAMVRLKNKPNKYKTYSGFSDAGDIVEMVEGYVDIQNVTFNSSCQNPSNSSEYIYGMLQAKETKQKNAIRMAAVQQMRLRGQHYNSSIDVKFTGGKSKNKLISIASAIIKGATADKEQTKDFLEAAFGIKSYCTKMSGNHTSVVRLNVQDGIKYGGGSRVKSIVVKDNWNTMQTSETTFNTQQNFSYIKEDGTTSGVAEYEPLKGGEENPLRQPHYYSNEKGILNSKKIMFELPATESLYPSAKVGYSRIVMETVPITTAGVPIAGYSLSSNGITVEEYYTAKDYPVISSATKVNKVNMNKLVKFVKFLGGKNYFHPGFSQGYYTELNDMHGRLKRMSTYSSTLGVSEAAFESTTYLYKTKDGDYAEGRANQLSSEADVLVNDGSIETRTLGEVSDAWIEMVEDDTQTIGGDIKFNIDNLIFGFIPVPIPVAVPDVDYSYRMRRTAVVNKLTSRTAMLDKVITQREGRTVVAENLLHDAENGMPLLVKSSNEYDAPIYSYKRPQHWLNNEFKDPWHNWKAKVDDGTWEGLIQNGDKIVNSAGTAYWVENAEDGTLKTASGTTASANASGFEGTIVESGYSGKTAALSSQIRSLIDPSNSSNKNFVLFEKYNNKVLWYSQVMTDLNTPVGMTAAEFYKCDQDPLKDCSAPDQNVTFCPLVSTEHTTLESVLYFYKVLSGDFASITFPPGYDDQLGNFTLRKVGNKVEATLGNTVLLLDWNDPDNLFLECMPGVLEAGVNLFADNLNVYDFINNNSNYSITESGDINPNPVRYKDRYNYKLAQKMTAVDRRGYSDVNTTTGFFETKIQDDGSFNAYVDYNFSADPADNQEWINRGSNLKYDPFGNLIESVDPRGVLSAELLDKDHVAVTASAINAGYYDVGFQSFEGYSGTYSGNSGHIEFQTDPSIYTSAAHSGKNAISTSGSNRLELTNLDPSRSYRLSFWQLGYDDAVSPVGTATLTVDAQNIDNWNLVTYSFTPGATSFNIDIKSGAILDDIRFYPADAAMNTFVFDPNTYRLIAELNINNFTTFYGYNEEGKVSFVKQETDNGIHTVSNSISHLKK